MNFFYCLCLLFLLQFSALSEGRPNLSDIDIATCKCQSYQSCKWSNESAKRITSGKQFPGEIQIFKDNICNKEAKLVWCCRNGDGKEVFPTTDQLESLKKQTSTISTTSGTNFPLNTNSLTLNWREGAHKLR